MENENLTGRYVKSTIKRDYFSIDAQEPLKILSQEGIYCTIEKFGSCCNAGDTSNWQLMPKGWTPEQPSLSVNDLVKYGYYYTKDKNSDFWMLYRFKQINSNDEAFYTCCITKYKEFTKDDWFNLDYRITRKATPEEIQWLDICSKEGKFIEFDKIKDYMSNSVNTFEKSELSLLEQAKLKYENLPIGTVIQGVSYKGTLVKKAKLSLSNYGDVWIKNDCIKENLHIDVYKDGKWAETSKIVESLKLPIVGEVYDSIPEYLEVIGKYFVENDQIGKIYKTSEPFPNYLQECSNKNFYNWLRVYNTRWFKHSTKEAYDKQFLLTDFAIKTHPVTPEECISHYVIEVGDWVISKNKDKPKEELVVGFHFANVMKLQGREDQYCHISNYKLVRKANTQTTTINKKPDISSAIQVGNDNTTNIVIPKSASVVLKNTENEVKIKINQTKTIKIN